MKNPLKSKTLWFNVPILAASVLVAVQDWMGALPDGTLPEGWEAGVASAIAFVNIILRFVTREPVGFGGGEGAADG